MHVAYENNLDRKCVFYSNQTGSLCWAGDKEMKNLVLGAYYWTYLIVQFPGNHLVKMMKKKYVTIVTMAIMSTMTVLTPFAARWDAWAVYVIRLVLGACTV